MTKSELYDDLCTKADALFKELNPCQIGNCGRTCAGAWKTLPGLCCFDCKHLTPTGCGIQCLGCKLYVCYTLEQSHPDLVKQLEEIRIQAVECGITPQVRITKEECLKDQL